MTRPSFIGYISDLTVRTDLSELSMCKGDPERCKFEPGYHEEQKRLDQEWRDNK